MPDKLFNFITLEGLQAFKEESESKSNGAYASKMTVEQNATTGVVTFKLYAEDNTLLDTKTLDLDTEHIIKSVSLDYTNKLLVFTMNDDTTLNCDISDLIDNLSSDIQTAIDNEATTRANEITRVEGLITTEENRAKGVENSKVDKVANATENNIALFDSNGNVKDSGKSINDVGKVATVSVGGGTPIQPDQDKNIDLPAYPTRLSLQINNVDNTSDSAKPVSTAQQTAIDSTGHKIDLEIDNTTFKIKAKLYDKNNTLISTSNEIDLPLESVVVGGSYDSVNKKVVLTLQNGTTIEFSVADLIYGLQSEITAQNPLSSDLVDDTNSLHKFVSANEKAQITTNQNDIADIKNGENLDSFADVEEELEAKADKSTTYTKTDVDNLLDDKADKTEIPTKTSDLENDSGFLTQHQDVSGKEDKSNKVNAFQNTPDNTHYPTEKLVKDSLDNKVDKVSGKGLSTNDYTTVEKQKLANIEAGAEVNDVNSVNGKTGAVVLDSDDISDTNKTHKFVTTDEKATWNGKQDTINDLAAIRSGASAGATAVQDNAYVHTDNNYTTAEKQKLAGLENYDDTEVRGLITTEANRATKQENKALHFKGAFDSDDGKTRQTGYLNSKKLLSLYHWGYNGATAYQMLFALTDSVEFLSNSSVLGTNSVGSLTKYTPDALYLENHTGFAEFKTNNGDNVIIITIENYTTFEQVENYLRNYDIAIQYKLATSYTDDGIIEGETILPLDSNMANKIRQKVVDGLNLTPYNLTTFPLNSVTRHLIAQNLPSGTYTLSLNLNTYGTNSQYIVYINDSAIGTFNNGTSATFTSNEYINSIKIYSNDALATSAQVMLVEADHPYPYSDFNQKEHITNDEATLLKQEWEKGLNLCDNTDIYFNQYNNLIIGKIPHLEIGIYTLSIGSGYSGSNRTIKLLDSTLSEVGSVGTFNNGVGTITISSAISNCYLLVAGGTYTSKPQVMLNEGSHPYPYQAYNGALVREKDLPKQAYLHHITFYGTIESTGTFIVHFDIKSDSAEAFTMSSIATYLDSIVHYTGNNAISCSGYFSNGANGLKYPIVSVKGYSNSDIYITVIQYSSGILLTYNCNGTIADVIE